ncbi:MAG: SDR family oxidoreductase [Christensenellaceae bacterium]|nr:SDR family oxidoreductase [Christensenellaceae bacterium]
MATRFGKYGITVNCISLTDVKTS